MLTRTAPIVVGLLLGSCSSFMHDDLPQCAVAPDVHSAVRFVYNYNTDSADKFAEQIGAVTLYVFDESGTLIRQIEHTVSANSIVSPEYKMQFDLDPGVYTLYASARENTEGYEASLLTSGAKFRRNPLSLGDGVDNIIYTLDHTNGQVIHGGLPLEHQWLTNHSVTLVVPEPPIPAEGDPQPADIIVDVEVPLQKLTNNVHLELQRDIETRADVDGLNPDDYVTPISVKDYNVRIVTANGVDKFDVLCNPKDDAKCLTYTPHKIEVVKNQGGKDYVKTDFGLSRCMYSENKSKHDTLYIYSNVSKKEFSFDLTQLLAMAKEPFGANGWSNQEFLDRQSDYTIRAAFTDDASQWKFIEIVIDDLNWSRRIQNVDL